MEGEELFSRAPASGGSGSGGEPLAARMRPRSLEEFVGQDPIVGPGRLLRRAIQADQLSSLILYGPPGSGKTTLARVIANTTKGRFITLNAVLSGVADIRKAIEEAKDEKQFYARRSILFVDEVHRWNKAQQDALLPWVENGTVILIGATTENPFFEVNRALVSRSRVFRLEALTREDLLETARRALADRERGYGKWKVEFDAGALEHLVDSAAGDARSLLNALELAVETTPASWPPPEGSRIAIGMEVAEESIQRSVVLYDKDGDYHYDVISAFIKSIRGSDPDASLYWLARMVAAGESPSFIFRRLLISAAEDVGLADPAAISVVEACAAAFDRIGFPEGNFHLAQATLYLANCPKSNSTMGFFDALNAVKAENEEVPDHLKDGSRDAEELGHGKDYLYPHAYRDHWVAQAYLPLSLAGTQYYHPCDQGWEARASGRLAERRELQLAAYLEAAARPGGPGKEAPELKWLRRVAERSGEAALKDRDAVFASLSPKRHQRILVLNAGEGLFLWEALRRCPEGLVLGACWKESEAAILRDYAARIPGLLAPMILVCAPEKLVEAVRALCPDPFELAAGRFLLGSASQRAQALEALGLLMGPGALCASQEALPGQGSRLSDILEEEDGKLGTRLREAEDAFYREQICGASGISPQEAIQADIRARGFTEIAIQPDMEEGPRFLSPAEMDAWLSPSSAYGSMLRSSLSGDAEAAIAALRATVDRQVKEGRHFSWRRAKLLISFRKP